MTREGRLYEYCKKKDKEIGWSGASTMLTKCKKGSIEKYQSRKSQNSILHIAFKNEATSSFIERLIEKAPGTVWLKDDNQRLPLHIACRNGVTNSILELLIKVAEGPDTDEDDILNTVDKDDLTPLHHRLLAKPPITMADVELLSGYGSFGKRGAIALADKDINLPLHLACQKETEIEVLKLLLVLYPQAIEEKNKHGEKPEKLITEENEKTRKVLLKGLKHWEFQANNPIIQLEGSWKFVRIIPENATLSVSFSGTTSNERVTQNVTEKSSGFSINLDVGSSDLLPAVIKGGLNYSKGKIETQTEIEKLTDSKGTSTTSTYTAIEQRRHIFQYIVTATLRNGKDIVFETKTTDHTVVFLTEEEFNTPLPPRGVLAETYFNNLRITHVDPEYDAVSLRLAAEKGGTRWSKWLETFSTHTPPNHGTFHLNFKSGGNFDYLTDEKATELVQHLPLTIKKLKIWYATFRSEFMDALIERVKKFEKLEELVIHYTYVGDEKGVLLDVGGEKRGQKVGGCLANVLGDSTTIKSLRVYNIDLVGSENMEVWKEALMKNRTLTILDLCDDEDLKKQLEIKTKDHSSKLTTG